MLEIGAGQDAVSEVEHVAGASAGPAQHVDGAPQHAFGGAEQRRRVEVALDGAVGADEVPSLVEGYAPVEADHVASRLAHRGKQGRGAGAEMHHGDAAGAHRVEDPPRVGQRELAVVARRERAHPRVEDLHGLGSRLDLGEQVIGDDGGEGVREPVPRLGLAVHQGLGSRVVARRAALDGVRGEGEGGPREPDEGHAAGELHAQQADGVEHVAESLAGFEDPEPVDAFDRPHRRIDDRPLALLEPEGDAQRIEREQQVREEDGGVDLDGVDRLQGHLGRELGLAADIEQAVAFAQRAVGAHVASRLAHEPHRRGVDRLAAACPEEAIVHGGKLLTSEGPGDRERPRQDGRGAR